MASSVGFHFNDSVPHGYPTSLAQTHLWEDGLLRGLPRHTDYPNAGDELEISQVSQMTDDSDIMPISQMPEALHYWRPIHMPELCAPDPDLGLTPEKRTSVPRSNLKSDAKDKAGLKVRFNVEASSESESEKSPEKYFTLEKDPSVKLNSNVIVERHSDLVFSPLSELTDEQTDSAEPKVYSYSVKQNPSTVLKDTQVYSIETVLQSEGTQKKLKPKTSGLLPTLTKGDNLSALSEDEEESFVTQEQEERPVVQEYNFPFTEEHDGVQDKGMLLSSALERPEYNSTLLLGHQLKQLAMSKHNVAKAVKHTLQKSDALRTTINEKAAMRVNTEGNMFQGLTSLEVPANDIIQQVEKEQMSKVKYSGKKRDCKSKESQLKEPDLMEFFTPDLQTEQVDLSVSGVYFPKETLSTASHEKAFDLYKHNLAWGEFD